MQCIKNLIFYLFVFLGLCCIEARSQTAYIISDSLIQSQKKMEGVINMHNAPQWKCSTEDIKGFENPSYNDTNWIQGNIVEQIDSLFKNKTWNKFALFRITFTADSSFYKEPWWLRINTISPSEIYLDGKLVMKNGKPASNFKEEELPVFSVSDPFFIQLPLLNADSTHVLAIRWSGHYAGKLVSAFPGTFVEYGPIFQLSSNNPWPQFNTGMQDTYIRVYLAAGLLLLVIIIQLYFYMLLRNAVNLGICLVATMLIIHLITSHPILVGYSIPVVLLDTLLFFPLFISIFSVFPWLAAQMLGVELGISNKAFSIYVLLAVIGGVIMMAFVGIEKDISRIYILLTLIHAFIWLVIVINKAHRQESPYRTIVSLAYFLPIGIVLLSYVIQFIGKSFDIDWIKQLSDNHLLNPLIITFYISVPVLTTGYIAKQNIDLLKNLSKEVDERTADLKASLSELKAAQSQLVQSEKMASLGELMAGIAHEIQNPLNFVNNFSEVSKELIAEVKSERLKANTERDLVLEEELLKDIGDNLTKINHHGKRADAIVKGMLEHSRSANSHTKELTDLNELLDEYVRLGYHGLEAKLKQEGKKEVIDIQVETDFDQKIGTLNIVPEEIGRVLLNMLNNSFFAVMEKKKKVTEPYVPTVSIRSFMSVDDDERGVEIWISDNGMGIPEKLKRKIFQPFFTTKPTGQGTGLGLSLSYDIISKIHGGKVVLESTENEGTTFKIWLPLDFQ